MSTNFLNRHLGNSTETQDELLKYLGFNNLDELSAQAIPSNIITKSNFNLLNFNEPLSEAEAINKLKTIVANTKVFKNYIGLGYYDCIIPAVIQRNILENPGWYTQYTPYQAEISQGRLEALLHFQTLVTELTGLPVANASLLDEATAAAEAMAMAWQYVLKNNSDANEILVSSRCHPQTIAVLNTRAEGFGIKIKYFDNFEPEFSKNTFAVLVQNPDTEGLIYDYSNLINITHKNGALFLCAADPLALVLLKAPGDQEADIVFGNMQRFGVPLGFGGPHAAFIATINDLKRLLPGRIIGVSKDKEGNPALRLALQTREQHIRREKATSNICTAQVLLAVINAMYAIYHGGDGLKNIAKTVNSLTVELYNQLAKLGFKLRHQQFFDTLVIDHEDSEKIIEICEQNRINLRKFDKNSIAISIDEKTSFSDVTALVNIFSNFSKQASAVNLKISVDNSLLRTKPFLTQPVFNNYHSETEFLRYLKKLEAKDLSLAYSMIPLGSCTMKLNATSEMLPLSWEQISSIHPTAPANQTLGYSKIFNDLKIALAEITGLADVSLQPNAGSQGEYAGLIVIRKFHASKNQAHRNICLIPVSAHGTNPASAVMAGLKVVAIACDVEGNIDFQDLKNKTHQHKDNLAALMITYPSTHGVYENNIKEVCDLVHEHGGQVYLDGANLNALVGLVKVSDIGADVCHINLHKTFCIPHGGGGPGMGPIAVAKHLKDFLPGHPFLTNSSNQVGAVSAAPYGSASILTISWMYMAMMGASGLRQATQNAILNANYIAKKLSLEFKILYKGSSGLVAHECILDCREFKTSAGIEVEDIAKRLIDYGFHAPTVSFPVPGTIMIEPTESESKYELDRFCEAMLAIRQEIKQIENNSWDRENNPLKNAPHTASMLASENWSFPYTRDLAVFPSKHVKQNKFWPSVARVDNAYGDRNLICTCEGM